MVSIQFRPSSLAILVLMPDPSRRHLRCPLDRCLLRPVGEVFEDSKGQLPYSIRYRVLWIIDHHCEREATIAKPCS